MKENVEIKTTLLTTSPFCEAFGNALILSTAVTKLMCFFGGGGGVFWRGRELVGFILFLNGETVRG